MANTDLLKKYGTGMGNEKIDDLSMTLQDIILKLSDGNPGAMTILARVVNGNPMNMMKNF